MAADFVVRYASFLGGDWGNIDPGRARENQYRGENVRLYHSELLGVRPGLKGLQISDLPAHPNTVGPWGFDIWHDELVVVLDQPYTIPIPVDANTPTAAVTPGAFATGAPTSHCRMAQFFGDLYFNHDGFIHKLPDVSRTLEQIVVPAPLKGLTRWNYYLVAWDVNNPQRLYFTDVGETGADPDTWGPNNFLDVGGNEPITALLPMYNYLYVAKASGWYAVSGVLAERPYVRKVANGNGPFDDRQAAITTDNRVISWGHDNIPVWFNGENPYLDDPFRVESLETLYPADAVVASPTGRHILMLGEPRDEFNESDSATSMLHYDQGRWSTHDFRGIAMGGIAGHDLRTATEKPPNVMFLVNRARVTGDPVEIYSYDLNSTRAKRESDLWSCACEGGDGELLDGYVEMPAFYDSQSRMVMVRNVIVQFRHWPSEIDGSLNELHCQLRPMGKFEGGSLDTQPQVWAEPSETANPEGSDETWRIGMGRYGWANGFQIVFPKMRGVALRSVEVHVEVRTARL